MLLTNHCAPKRCLSLLFTYIPIFLQNRGASQGFLKMRRVGWKKLGERGEGQEDEVEVSGGLRLGVALLPFLAMTG